LILTRTQPEGTTDRRWVSDITARSALPTSRGDTRQATHNRGPFDIATLAIFPEHLEFEGQEVLHRVVEGAAGRTAK
jgi:hypothetical protein